MALEESPEPLGTASQGLEDGAEGSQAVLLLFPWKKVSRQMPLLPPPTLSSTPDSLSSSLRGSWEGSSGELLRSSGKGQGYEVTQGVLLEPWEEGVGQPLALPLVVPVLEVPVVSESTHPRPSTQQHSVAQQRGYCEAQMTHSLWKLLKALQRFQE
ncbi:uncharacterized protein LOC144329505 [Macaca mulatta]